MKKSLKPLVAVVLAMTPAAALAQTPPTQTNTLADLARLAVYYFNIAIELLIGLAIVVFVWNIYQYFFAEKDKENKGERGMYLLWSVIGFFVIVSFWGLVNLLSNTFNLNTSAPSNFYNLYGGSSYSGSNAFTQSGTVSGPTVTPGNGFSGTVPGPTVTPGSGFSGTVSDPSASDVNQ